MPEKIAQLNVCHLFTFYVLSQVSKTFLWSERVTIAVSHGKLHMYSCGSLNLTSILLHVLIRSVCFIDFGQIFQLFPAVGRQAPMGGILGLQRALCRQVRNRDVSLQSRCLSVRNTSAADRCRCQVVSFDKQFVGHMNSIQKLVLVCCCARGEVHGN